MARPSELRLILEMVALYVAAPLIVFAVVRWNGAPLIVLLAPVLVLVIALLSRQPGFSWRGMLEIGINRGQLAEILSLFLVLGGALAAFTWVRMPEEFLAFPRQRPVLWLAIMVFYPVISVTAQELTFRVLFVQRYGGLFEGRVALAVLVNAALFGFAHIIFESWLTVIVSFFGGLIFAWRYLTTLSFWAVVLEHSLYGMLIFTVGLGRYFLAGVPFM